CARVGAAISLPFDFW
nr:immunoglobulin heavy chain junction region [Macaca mulatta]MOW24586.1 immunoglobulin heavy chain junction region [Macaca mulatta]MOW24771.1 immunoglobulin heavy chain junction region [Macaca mulatta]MOW25208.1 immunoglobulin heavy chain junction region [Macaca mulatta]MOW25248.1 immunoglobulin heavy chain junction region [Macaca mulatta]